MLKPPEALIDRSFAEHHDHHKDDLLIRPDMAAAKTAPDLRPRQARLGPRRYGQIWQGAEDLGPQAGGGVGFR